MALTLYNIKKWSKMFVGKSILHVNQNIGKVFSSTEVKGYYNDLTEKVTRKPELLDSEELPTMETPTGETITFPVGIFQYGLGAYDLYLLTGEEERYYKKFWDAVEWTISHQLENGAWDTFSWINPEAPYGAMAQGEAVSLLIRAYKESKNEKYLHSASNAVQFLILSVEKGGCTLYANDDSILLEFTNLPAVLNGWIFAWWGLYDYVQMTNDKEVDKVLSDSLTSMVRYLPKFNNSYWSLYDLNENLASPFYHNLHIAQMQAMYALTQKEEFSEFERLWRKRQSNKIFKILAVLKKGWQKIKE